jgi:2,3-dihydroxy-p-cumate/2,3-dihydroxybenzoate 3,4-dioxygenase
VEIAPQRLGYVMLDVTDLDRSTKFFTNVVHLHISERQGDRVFLRGGTHHHWIVLRQAAIPALARIAMQVESAEHLELLKRRLRDCGTECEEGEGMASDRVARYLRFRDPSGTPLELYVGMAEFNERPPPGHVDVVDIQHVVLFQKDVLSGYRFYTDVLGLGLSDWIEERTAFLHFRNGWHHGIGVTGPLPDSQFGLDHICFSVPDLNNVMRARALVQRFNVPITSDLLKHAASGSTSFYFAGEDSIVEFAFGSSNFATDPTLKPRNLKARPDTVNVWLAGLDDVEPIEVTERMRQRAEANMIRRGRASPRSATN